MASTTTLGPGAGFRPVGWNSTSTALVRADGAAPAVQMLPTDGRVRRILTNRFRARFQTTPTAPGASTYHYQIVLPCETSMLRIGVPQAHLSASYVNSCGIAIATSNALGADNSTASIDPTTTGGTWVKPLILAAATANLASPGENSREEITWSEWTEHESVVRTDGGVGAVLHVRILIGLVLGTRLPLTEGTGSYSGVATDWETSASWNASRPYRTRTKVGNHWSTLSPDTFDVTTSTPVHPAIIVQYQPKTAVTTRTVMYCGDSITEGVGGASKTVTGFAWELTKNLNTASRVVERFNGGLGSTVPFDIASTTANAGYAMRLRRQIAAGIIPDCVVYSAFSPNNTAPLTAQYVNKFRWGVGEIKSLCDQYGIPLVIWGCLPATNAAKAWGATDSLRVAWDAELKTGAWGTYVDVVPAISTTTHASGQIEPVGTSDGIHPTDAMHTAIAALLQPYVEAALA